MRRNLPILSFPTLALACLFTLTTRAHARAETPEHSEVAAPLAPLTPGQAIVLGLVEGVTEFLPVSSTGHLILTNQFLALDSEEALRDAAGSPLWHKPPNPDAPEGEPLTIKVAADTYTVVIQVGAILAVLSLYWPSCLKLLRGLLGRDREGLLLLRNLVLAFVPVALVGLLASDFIEAYLFSVAAVIGGLVGGAVLMLAVEAWRRKKTPSAAHPTDADKQPAQLTPTESLKVGLIQCLALWPGASRSMLTIVGGYWAGLSPARAAEFSFLVGLPVLAGAAILKGWRSGPEMIAVFGAPSVLLGMAVAAISAALAVKFLIKILTRSGLAPFALYRLVLAAAVAVVVYL
ncbi:hypothetical protein AXK12_01970 [Cephaloticoccus capnophilus]|uniref:Undecaprenyl-diphosphatase n=1 Tax=Cephaloticoccus capnophilus TaxID=1548208 RepID=A0A139SSD1_9BACT|nr:undecaprenyl-diphosphate phosphatase [Cephaloticoccus capnophilus]KXU37390.1 hypothetical protein AXK12_01970 [Cephaloticoccus capnophilus]